MSHFGSLLSARRPGWGPLPPELEQAWQWMEEQGFGEDVPAGHLLTPYGGEDVLGAPFFHDIDLDDWFDGPAPAELLPVALAASDGSIVALWRQHDAVSVVLLGSEGETGILAGSPLAFLQLLAIGYEELTPLDLGTAPSCDECVEALSPFREWVAATFDVEVPSEWPPLDDDEFSTWVRARLGQPEPLDEVTAGPVDAPVDAALGDTLAALLDLLGERDGEALATRLGDVLGLPLGPSVRRSGVSLRPLGVQTIVQRGRLETVFLTINSELEPGEYPRPDELVRGLESTATPAEAEAVLGAPEAANEPGDDEEWRRWSTGRGFLHIQFGPEQWQLVTVMRTAP